jgi:hypothetical protein
MNIQSSSGIKNRSRKTYASTHQRITLLFPDTVEYACAIQSFRGTDRALNYWFIFIIAALILISTMMSCSIE